MPVRFRVCRRRRFVRQSRDCRRKRTSSELENWALVCTTVLVMPQADESLDSRRHAIYFRSQYSFTLNFLILLFLTFCNRLILSPVYSFFPTFCNKWILSLTIFRFQVLDLFRTVHTHTPRCLTPAPRFFLSEVWVCYRVLGLFRTFHKHTTMLNARPTILSFGVLGLLSSFRLPAGKGLFERVCTWSS